MTHPSQPTARTSAILTLTVSFDGMTWADLRQFVAMAKNERDSDEVLVDFHPSGDPVGLYTFISVDRGQENGA